jgi:hypothetical protein
MDYAGIKILPFARRVYSRDLLTSMDGRRLRRKRQRRGLGTEDVRVERGDRQPSAQAGSGGGAHGVGQGVGQRGREGGLAQARATAGFRRLATSVGRGEDVFVALSEQEDEPMDYERLAATSEAFIYVAMTRVMVRRLARAQ